MALRLKLTYDDAAIERYLAGLKKMPAMFLLKTGELNYTWMKDLRDVVGRAFLAKLEKEALRISVEESKYYYRNRAGELQGMTPGLIYDILHRPIDKMNDEQLEDYAHFYWWTQGILDKTRRRGYEFDVENIGPRYRRVQYNVPVEGIPREDLKRLFPRDEDFLRVTQGRDKRVTMMKYIPNEGIRDFSGVMIGDWFNADIGRGPGGTQKVPYNVNHDLGPGNPGILQELNPEQGFRTSLRPDDARTVNKLLYEIAGRYIPPHIPILHKMYRTQLIPVLVRQMNLRKFGIK